MPGAHFGRAKLKSKLSAVGKVMILSTPLVWEVELAEATKSIEA